MAWRGCVVFWRVCGCGWVGVCFVVSDTHVCFGLSFLFWFCFLFVLFVWLITVWWFVAVVVWFVGCGVLLGCGVGLGQWGYWVVVSCLFGVRLWARVCLWGAEALAVVGERGCLGAQCVVWGGGLPVWLGDAVAGGGVGVSFDAGLRVFVLSGVSAPGSGSAVVSECGALVSGSGSSSGVRVCVPCARAVFGDGWCSLVLRRWARAAGVDVSVVSGLLSSAAGCVPASGVSVSSASVSASGSASSLLRSPLSISAPGSGSAPVSSPASSRVGRVGVGFGARVRDWGARVGVGGGVVSGGGVVLGWWARARGRVSALVSGVGVWGLVGLCGVCALVLVSVLVLVG